MVGNCVVSNAKSIYNKGIRKYNKEKRRSKKRGLINDPAGFFLKSLNKVPPTISSKNNIK